jgi:PTS system cellobiose-specific IIC component
MSRSSDESRLSLDDSNPLLARVNWLEGRVAPFAQRFGEAPAVRALRESLPVSFVVLLFALGALVCADPALLAARLNDSLAQHAITPLGHVLVERLRASIPGAFAVMSMALVVVLSIRLAARLRYPYVAMLTGAAGAFAFALPAGSFRSFGTLAKVLGNSGLFTAIVVCLATAGAIALARRRFGPERGALAGTAGIVLFAWLLSAAHVSVAGILADLIAPLGQLGDSFAALFILTGIESALFLFGIHGPALLAALVLPVYLNLQFVNAEAAIHHEPLPHIVVVSTFLFVFPGGAGATLPLVILLLFSKVVRLRKFAYATILPSMINLNEPVVFGLPLVYNPILGIPFVLAPLALCGTTYAAIALGLVRAPVYYVPSTLPLFLNVFLATFDWRSTVLIAVNIVIAGAIYFPFVRMYERSEQRAGEPA